MAELNTLSLLTDANLKGYWRMEGNWNDSSSSGYNLTANAAPTFVTGKYGQAGNFVRASSQYSNNTTVPNLRVATSQSMGGWINLTAVNVDQRIMGIGDATPTNYTDLVLQGASGKINYELSGLSPANVLSATVLATGTWYFIVGVYDSVGATLKIYINGLLDNTASGITGAHTAGSGDFAIGRLGAYNADYLGGIVDDAFFFNRVLTQAEITALYQAGAYLKTGRLWGA